MATEIDVRMVSEHCARLRLDAPPRIWWERDGAQEWHNPDPCDLIAEERLAEFGWSCECECHE